MDSPSNLVFHPNSAVVPSEDAAILAARAHNLAAQAAHIDLLTKNGLNVPLGFPATKVGPPLAPEHCGGFY